MITLHKQLSVILRVVSCTRKIDTIKYETHCKETMINIAQNFPWCKLNHTLHGTIQHSVELIRMNGGESLGWYSEEGLEANNKDIRNYLEHLSRKSDSNKQIEDVHHRLLERSDPFLISVTSRYTGAKLCTVCKASDHTVRTHNQHQFAVHGLEDFFLWYTETAPERILVSEFLFSYYFKFPTSHCDFVSDLSTELSVFFLGWPLQTWTSSVISRNLFISHKICYFTVIYLLFTL